MWKKIPLPILLLLYQLSSSIVPRVKYDYEQDSIMTNVSYFQYFSFSDSFISSRFYMFITCTFSQYTHLNSIKFTKIQGSPSSTVSDCDCPKSVGSWVWGEDIKIFSKDVLSLGMPGEYVVMWESKLGLWVGRRSRCREWRVQEICLVMRDGGYNFVRELDLVVSVGLEVIRVAADSLPPDDQWEGDRVHGVEAG